MTYANEWTAFSLAGIWTTASNTLPLNECPVSNIQVCEDDACATVLTEASGLRITSSNGVFSFEIDKSVVTAEPQITRYFKVISYGVEIIESFTIELINQIDCSGQTISVTGEANSPITRELAKNDGLQALFTALETAALFRVSDARPGCAITEYILYKTVSAEITSADTDLYARLAGASYASDGAISIVTDIDANLAELDVVFYIAAKTGDGSSALKPVITAVTPSITVTLSCIDVTSLTTAYTANNGVSLVVDYTTDGFFYKIFIEDLGSTLTVDLSAVATYVTDRPSDC